jgi:UDP-3-O-[3-hydroxymyristoyl] N-acetylglucosamine deacetylase
MSNVMVNGSTVFVREIDSAPMKRTASNRPDIRVESGDMSDRKRASELSRVTGPRQRTLKSPVRCTGIGLHSGVPVNLALFPASVDHGVVFQRTDVESGDVLVPARWSTVVETFHCTAIANEAGVTVSTIEHLMAALAGMGIDNVLVTLDGPEVPIMDGSSAPFVFLVECAGTVEQPAARRAIRVQRPVSVADKGRVASLSPADTFRIDLEIDFGGTAVARQEFQFHDVNGSFKADIARARTFGFLHEVDSLRAAGLALGGSLDNAVVVSGDRVLNEGGLRYGDEFVRHKVLDCIGDLALAGAPILGHFQGVRTGHAMNNLLLRELFSNPANYCVVEGDAAWADQGETTDFQGLSAVA